MEEKIENDRKQEYLKMFDEIFGTNTQKYIDLENVPLLKLFYNELTESLSKNSKTYNILQQKRSIVLQELEMTLTEEQYNKIDEYGELTGQMELEREQQIFALACIMSAELNRESKMEKGKTATEIK